MFRSFLVITFFLHSQTSWAWGLCIDQAKQATEKAHRALFPQSKIISTSVRDHNDGPIQGIMWMFDVTVVANFPCDYCSAPHPGLMRENVTYRLFMSNGAECDVNGFQMIRRY